MPKTNLPKREDILTGQPVIREEQPSLKLYGRLLAFAVFLLLLAFFLAKPDWPGFFLNLATEIVGAIIILALVEKKLRPQELEHLKSRASSLQIQLYVSFFPSVRKLVEYLENTGLRYDRSISDLYFERPALEQEIKNERENFFLVGPAGSGKTTELQRYYLNICRDTISNLSSGRVPIYISSRRITNSIDYFEDTLRIHFAEHTTNAKISKKQITDYLLDGRAILIVDALDEVKPEDIKKVLEILSDFSKKYPETQLIVSSRPYSIKTGYLSLKAINKIIEIPDLSEEERKRILQNYEIFRKKA